MLGFRAGLRAVDVLADDLETVLLGVLHAVLELSLDAALVLPVGRVARVYNSGLSGVRWVFEFHLFPSPKVMMICVISHLATNVIDYRRNDDFFNESQLSRVGCDEGNHACEFMFNVKSSLESSSHFRISCMTFFCSTRSS